MTGVAADVPLMVVAVGAVQSDAPLSGLGDRLGAAVEQAASHLSAASRCFRTGADAAGRIECLRAHQGLELARVSTAEQAYAVAAATDSRLVIESERPDLVEDTLVYDDYLRVRRTSTLAFADAVASNAPVFVDLAADLAGGVRIPADDAARLAAFAAATLDAPEDGGDRPPESPTSGEVIPYCSPDPLRRWKSGHRLYALANRAAARALDRAAEAWRSGDYAATSDALRDATDKLRVISAAMDWASAVSSAVYRDQIRLTMKLPDLELTGSQNLDHFTFRTALRAFLDACPLPWREIRDIAESAAIARDGLLQADLHDLERHMALTYRLVGDSPALDEHDRGSAIMALRALYQRRTGSYLPMMRLGGLLAAPVPPARL